MFTIKTNSKFRFLISTSIYKIINRNLGIRTSENIKQKGKTPWFGFQNNSKFFENKNFGKWQQFCVCNCKVYVYKYSFFKWYVTRSRFYALFFEKRWALNHGYFIERQLKKNDLFVNGLASLILTTFVNYSLHRNKTNSK